MKQSKIADLKPDAKNGRKHPARNMAVLERSLEKHGAARSIVERSPFSVSPAR